MPNKWFVLRTGTNFEKRVRKQLEMRIQTHDLRELIPQILVPTERKTEIKGGKRRTTEYKVYPGYIMAEINVDDEGTIPPEVWHLIRETPGQVKFVGSQDQPDRPEPLGQDEVDKMLQRQALVDEQSDVPVNLDFEVGEMVRIREGSFENFEGAVEELYPDKGMVKVSIMVFGRPTPIDFETWKVEKIKD